MRAINGDIAVVSHRRDFDGIASAAEMLKVFGSRIKLMLFTNPSTNEFLDAMKRLEGFGRGTVVIADISINSGTVPELHEMLEGLEERGSELIWLDHHPWPAGASEIVGEHARLLVCGENPMFSGAELVYENLCNGDGTCRRLAELAHITDFNLKPDDDALDLTLMRLSRIIAFLDSGDSESDSMRAELVRELAAGRTGGPVIERLDSLYKKSEAENLESLNATMRSERVPGHVVGIAFAHNLQSNMACDIIRERTGADICVFVTTKDGAAHVRSGAGIDSSALASALGGNGHPQASGFTPKGDFHGFGAKGIAAYSELVFDAAKAAYGKEHNRGKRP